MNLKIKSGFLLIVASTLACGIVDDSVSKKQQDDTKVSDQVIYGDDGRRDIYQVSEEKYLSRALATVALVDAAKLSPITGGWQISGVRFGLEYGLCASEPYLNQETAAFCSGSLVGNDLILTAGHCISTPSDCRNVRFVFGFAAESENSTRKNFGPDDVYECKEVLHSQATPNGADFAIIRLNREVVGRKPLKWRESGTVSPADPVYVIGHPAGLPQKVTLGGKVRGVQAEYFVANVDTYGGNSGSPVFNEITGKIEGVLVRGENDFVYERGCRVSNRCSEDSCRGEDITRIDKVLAYLPSGEVPPPPPPTGGKFEASAGPNATIPDNSTKGASSVIKANQSLNNRQVKVSINIKHSYRGDLVVTLTAPNGKSAVLHNRTGGSADDIIGTYEPASFAAATSAGSWTLTVKDLARMDVGRLVEWRLVFE